VPVQLVPPPKPQAHLDSGAGAQSVTAAQSSAAQGTVAQSATAAQSSSVQGTVTQSATAESVAVPVVAALTAASVSPAADATFGLATLQFEPQRLPVAVGGSGTIAVILDAGSAGVTGPLHLAYDPARLEVGEINTADVTVANGRAQVQAANATSLGMITLSWSGTALVGGTLAQLQVKPRMAGEIQLFFAGPVGAVISKPATIVAVPNLAAGALR
jgi:hypothetical protein